MAELSLPFDSKYVPLRKFLDVYHQSLEATEDFWAATVLYEGAPDYPSIDRWWEIIEKYGATIFYTSPTAIRMFMGHGEDWLKKHDLATLEDEASVEEVIKSYQELKKAKEEATK